MKGMRVLSGLKRLVGFARNQNHIISDPAHPSLQGQYQGGGVHYIDFFREERLLWESIEILLTLRCPFVCNHCACNSSPDRSEAMSRSLLRQILEGLAEEGMSRYICLFGGEPMLEPELTRFGIETTLSLGMTPSVVTSGFYARDAESARCGAAVMKGVGQLLVSTDRPHMEFLDIATTLRAVEGALREGIQTAVCYTAEPDEFFARTPLPNELVKGCERLGVSIVVPPIAHGGRAANRPEVIPELSADVGCCKIDSPLFDCAGNVCACGMGWAIPREGDSSFFLGRFPDVSIADLIRRRRQADVLSVIRQEGPFQALQRLAQGRPGRLEQLRATPPSSPCGACQMLSRWRPQGTAFWNMGERV